MGLLKGASSHRRQSVPRAASRKIRLPGMSRGNRPHGHCKGLALYETARDFTTLERYRAALQPASFLPLIRRLR